MALGVKFNKEDYNRDISIPAHVRYDENVSTHSMIAYGEILKAPFKNGLYSFDVRIYSKLFHVDKRTIIRWLDGLEAAGYIKYKAVRGADDFVVETRLIKILK